MTAFDSFLINNAKAFNLGNVMFKAGCVMDHSSMFCLDAVHLSENTLQTRLCVCSAAGLDEADTEAVDALMGMTGLLYAH